MKLRVEIKVPWSQRDNQAVTAASAIETLNALEGSYELRDQGSRALRARVLLAGGVQVEGEVVGLIVDVADGAEEASQ